MAENSLVANQDEYLDPGYDAVTPDGDNLLLDFARAEAEGWQRWADAGGGRHGASAELGVTWVDTGCKSVFGNPSHWSRPLQSHEANEAIDLLEAAYGGGEGGAFVIFSAFPTPDLRNRGLGAVGHPPLMVRPPADHSIPHRPAHLHIERVKTAEQLAHFEQTIVEGFPVEELLPWQSGSFVPSGLLDEEAWHLFIGYDEGKPVATAAAFVSDQVVDVTWVACQEASRRQGFGEAMTWAATLADPGKPALLIASDDGRALYQRMGYLTMSRYTIWIGQRPGS